MDGCMEEGREGQMVDGGMGGGWSDEGTRPAIAQIPLLGIYDVNI